MHITKPTLLSRVAVVAVFALTTATTLLRAKEIDIPFKAIVVSGHGIELQNINKNTQTSYFMTYERPSFYQTSENNWKTYNLPPLEIGGKVRESCAIEGMPLKMDDGTIYIACAGGVLNRLKPIGNGNRYTHDYWILDGAAKTPAEVAGLGIPESEYLLRPEANQYQAELILDGDKVLFNDMRSSIELPGQKVPLLEALRSPLKEAVPSNQLFVNKWVNRKQLRNDNKAQAGKYGISYAEAIRHLKAGDCWQNKETERSVQISSLKKKVKECDSFKMKDGIFKVLAKGYWNRNSFIKTPKQAREFAEKLMPDLGSKWTDSLFNLEGKFKFKEERMPFFKVRMIPVPGEQKGLFIATVTNNMYLVNHTDGYIVRLGQFSTGTGQTMDSTALAALAPNLFVVGNMGDGTDKNTLPSLQVVEIHGFGEVKSDIPTISVNQEMTDSLTKALFDYPSESGAGVKPRIKGIASYQVGADEYEARCQPGETTLYLRTKHTGRDNMLACVKVAGNKLTVPRHKGLAVTDHYNQQYMAATASAYVRAPEIEDILRDQPLWDYGKLEDYRYDSISAYRDNGNKIIKSSVKVMSVPPLPKFLRHGGYGLNGIYISQ